MAERAVERRFYRIVKQYRAESRKLNTLRNDPDRLVLMRGGKAFFVELKRPGETPRPSQLRRHAKLRRMGFEVMVLDGTDWTPLFTKLAAGVK